MAAVAAPQAVPKTDSAAHSPHGSSTAGVWQTAAAVAVADKRSAKKIGRISTVPVAAEEEEERDEARFARFDGFDVPGRCRELLQRLPRMPSQPGPSPWSWDIMELFEESEVQLEALRVTHADLASGCGSAVHWGEIKEAFENEKNSWTLPIGLRRQCEDLLGKRDAWLSEFDSELAALRARAIEVRDRLLFEDPEDQAGWFSSSGVTPQEIQRLVERHLELHQRTMRLACQLKLLCRSLRQQGAVSSRRRAFQARTVSDKLHSSLLSLAAVAVAPVPGSSELWLATTTMMWLDKDQAWQHVVYEHPRDGDTDSVLGQFESLLSRRARRSLMDWSSMPTGERRSHALVHNASVRRVIVQAHLVNAIDGSGARAGTWTSALEAHPLGSVMKNGLKNLPFGGGSGKDEDEDGKIIIGAQRFAMVPLPPKPDTNWAWRGVFSYGDTKVGECWLREGGIFSFICVDCGLRVGERGETEEADDKNRQPSMDEDGALRDVEVVNGTDEVATVKVFAPITGGSAHHRLFRSALAERSLGPGESHVFEISGGAGQEDGGKPQGVEKDFDVEIRIGNKKTHCEVLGGQVVHVDGIMMD